MFSITNKIMSTSKALFNLCLKTCDPAYPHLQSNKNLQYKENKCPEMTSIN